MATLDIYPYVFPIAGGNFDKPGVLAPKKVFGTAFSIGGGFYLTAGHVLRSALASPRAAALFSDGPDPNSRWRYRLIDAHESADEADLGCFSATIPNAGELQWISNELPLAHPVKTVGYPHGFTGSEPPDVVLPRAFEGHVVVGRTWARLPINPRIYELSFQCPRGLSGAPLWRDVDGLQVAGVILGNEITEMTVYSEQEIIEDGGVPNVETVRKLEALHLGIAIQSSSILSIHFELLKSTLGEWLQARGLLTDGGNK